ncbi:mevalonate-3-phosphate 5-kinase [Picrophilus oshimae]|uniref:Hypothetical phosphoglycerate kinase n=1 Tax=Picrophilus torridus (strain ATCC 700027 / DSM 9790 / JCM 10055 / NBRC 100828 / KAW 2/3) TaxID=1122961 RepID=Q6L1T8_PICTO|nr:mevalonate-3-phosphate 5-kinase [Picrophilus oshimae]AAT43064.1 hypothetical phosphoglycerate kinase [Picrophilus oshimae DSM 9789]
MIVFIGGIPGVGKTSLSAYIARKKNIDIVLSGDYLREFLRSYLNDEIMNVSVYDAWRFFGPMSNENVIKGYLYQARLMYNGYNKIISRALRNGESMVIESLYFDPGLFDNDLFNKIKVFYIYISDIEIHRSRLLSRTMYTHKNDPGERLAEQLPVYKIMEDYSIKKCGDYNVKKIDNINFDETMELLGDLIE